MQTASKVSCIYDYVVQLLTFCFIVYINGFRYNVKGVMSMVPIPTTRITRWRGADSESDTKNPSATA